MNQACHEIPMLLLCARYISWIHPTVRMQINGHGTVAQLTIRTRSEEIHEISKISDLTIFLNL